MAECPKCWMPMDDFSSMCIDCYPDEEESTFNTVFLPTKSELESLWFIYKKLPTLGRYDLIKSYDLWYNELTYIDSDHSFELNYIPIFPKSLEDLKIIISLLN